jgi:hypothetical protein
MNLVSIIESELISNFNFFFFFLMMPLHFNLNIKVEVIDRAEHSFGAGSRVPGGEWF